MLKLRVEDQSQSLGKETQRSKKLETSEWLVVMHVQPGKLLKSLKYTIIMSG